MKFGESVDMSRQPAVQWPIFNPTIALILVTTVTCMTMTAEPAGAAESQSRLTLARQQYDQGQYQDAAENLRLVIYDNKGSALAWLLLGQSYQKLGQINAARQTYECVSKYFPKSPESVQALQNIQSLPKSAADSTTLPKGSPDVVSGSMSAGANASQAKHDLPSPSAKAPPGLKDRISVITPRFGHPSVSPGTVAIVKAVVAGLPPQIYKILDRGGVCVFVTPNLIDRFPEGVGAKHPVFGTYLSSEFGRTYERHAYVCERLGLEDGSTDLQNPLDPEVIKGSAYTMLAHALDSCLEAPSKNEQFFQLYKQDLDAADPTNTEQLRVYMVGDATSATEVFAALTSSLMGNDTPLVRKLDRTFLRSRAWIQSRIQAVK